MESQGAVLGAEEGGADKMTGSQGVRPDRQVLQGPTIDRESRHISEK